MYFTSVVGSKQIYGLKFFLTLFFFKSFQGNMFKNKDKKSFQYHVTVALNHKDIPIHSEKISNIEKYTDNYNCRGIKCPA